MSIRNECTREWMMAAISVMRGWKSFLRTLNPKTHSQKYGGKVTGSLSGKTKYLVAGVGCGESKMEQAQKKGVQVTEQELFMGSLSIPLDDR
jgi:DNA ligase (NAD+)